MKQITVALIIILSLISKGYGQDIHDVIADETCACAEERGGDGFEAIEPCIEKAVINNLKPLLGHYNKELITELDDVAIEEVGVRLMKNCVYLMNKVPDTVKDEIPKEVSTNAMTCADVKNNDFYYVQPNVINPQVMDTTFTTFSKGMYLERMKGGKTYSLLDIRWENECAFTLTFKESNDDFKKILSEPGDEYYYEIVGFTEKSIFLKMIYKEVEYHIELVKLSL